MRHMFSICKLGNMFEPSLSYQVDEGLQSFGDQKCVMNGLSNTPVKYNYKKIVGVIIIKSKHFIFQSITEFYNELIPMTNPRKSLSIALNTR